MRHVRHHIIVNVLALAKKESPVFDPLQALAYPLSGLPGQLALAAGRQDIGFQMRAHRDSFLFKWPKPA
jgi:hypothetical protein